VRAQDDEEPPPSVRRFLLPDHVHDRDCHAGGWYMSGPFVFSAIGCRRGSDLGGFAEAIWTESAFGEFLAARIADGSTDLETVRALIAVPPRSEDKEASDDLLRTGRELHAAFHGPDPGRDDVWDHVDAACQREPVRIIDR
jgi:hypothetical protein